MSTRLSLFDQSAVLHGFPGDVEGQILAIDDPAQKAQPFRKEAFGFAVDKHISAIETDPYFGAIKSQSLDVIPRDKENRIDSKRGVGGEVQRMRGSSKALA